MVKVNISTPPMSGPIYGMIFSRAAKKAITIALLTPKDNKIREYIVNNMDN